MSLRTLTDTLSMVWRYIADVVKDETFYDSEAALSVTNGQSAIGRKYRHLNRSLDSPSINNGLRILHSHKYTIGKRKLGRSLPWILSCHAAIPSIFGSAKESDSSVSIITLCYRLIDGHMAKV
jgi:hypothetical protein